MTRLGYFLVTVATVQGFAVLALWNPAPRLVWNATASAPIGLYAIAPGRRPETGELALVMPPPDLSGWMAHRHYVPLGIPLLKPLGARPGQRICRTGAKLLVDGRAVATARTHDRAGRPLPVWSGCRTLKASEILPLNGQVADSLDGRYFGPLSASALIGSARPLFTRSHPGAPLVWHGWWS